MKKRIISALLALSMVVAMPISTALADEMLPTDDVTSGQDTSVPEAPNEDSEEDTEEDVTEEDVTTEVTDEGGGESTTEDIVTASPTEETPADETEAAENNLVAYSSGHIYEDLTYTIENNQITITDCTLGAVSVDIPAEINGIPVTSIGNYAFEHCGNLTNITISDSVTHIGICAFIDCKGLTSITIPNSVTSIGSCAFETCEGLTSITIPNGVTSIDEGTFSGCTSLTSVTIPNSVTSIGGHAFAECTSLTSITIPDSVTSIGEEVFYLCESLANITISKNITSIAERAFDHCVNLTSITIPNGVTSIDNKAFCDCKSLTSVKIPNSVISIGYNAFFNCTSLTNITISDSVTYIGNDAFWGCDHLTDVYYTGNEDDWKAISNIDNNYYIYSYYHAKIHYNSTETHYSGKCGDNAFWTFENETLTISGTGKMYDYPSYGTSASSYAPWHNMYYNSAYDIKCVVIEDGITSIGDGAFINCDELETVNMSNSIISIGIFSFEGCSKLKKLTLSKGITDFGIGAFSSSGIEHINIPDGVTYIASSSFADCNHLKSITIPKSINKIESRAFMYCNKLDVYYAGNKTEWETIVIDNEYNEAILNATIHYNSTEPETESISGILCTGADYTVTWQCRYNLDLNDEPTNVKVYIDVKSKNKNVKSIMIQNENKQDGIPFPWELAPYYIPKSEVTEIVVNSEKYDMVILADYAFKDYKGLKKVRLPSVDCFYYSNFENCTSLEEISISNFTEDNTRSGSIGENAFAGCKNLKSTITIPKNYHVSPTAFEGCSNVTLRCYKQSPAHTYAIENNIKFELITASNEKTMLPFYSPLGNKTTYWDIGWNWDLFNLPTTQYYSRLAAFGMSLSAATESDSPVRAMNMLKNDLGFDEAEGYNYSGWNAHNPGVVCAYKKIAHKDRAQEYIIVVAIRGTTSVGDGFTDVLSTDFGVTANNIKSKLDAFMKDNNISKEDIQNNGKIFVTGHSLGGAVANKLAVELNDEYGLNRVSAYTFAAPATINLTTDMGNALSGFINMVIGKKNTWKKDQNIFNIIHDADNVPFLKSYVGNRAWYGETIEFEMKKLKNHPSYNQKLYDTFREISDTTLKMTSPIYVLDLAILDLGLHHVETYMAYVLSDGNFTQSEIDAVKHIKIVKIACPVDVEVYDSNNQLIGAIINDTITDSSSNAIAMYTENGEKYLLLMDDDDYTLKINSTGTGTMDYSVYDVSLGANEIVDQKEFKNVSLENGKKFTSHVSVWDKTDLTINSSEKVDTPEVPLYVIDDKGEPEKEVLPDGNGTEVPINNDDKPTTPDIPDKPVTPDNPSNPTTPDNGGNSSNTNMGTVIPFGGTKTESLTVTVENKVTGKTSKAVAKKTGSSVTVKLGTENNGYYANIYTTDDEFVASAIIENGRAKFNAPDGVKLAIIIDSIAYGEDVSSAAVVYESNDNTENSVCMIIIIIASAVFGSSFIAIKRFAENKR